MKTTKVYFATILSLVCCGGFVSQSAAADSSFYVKAKGEGRVVLYTSLAAEDNKPFRSAFENANPGVKLEIYRASGTTVLQKILTENRAGANLVDVVLTEGTVLHALKDKNLLVKFDSPERNAFDSRFKDKEGYWTDVYPTVHSIPYNTKLVAQQDLPKRYTDLLDPKWKGKLGANRNAFMFQAAMLNLYGQEKGEDFLRKLDKGESKGSSMELINTGNDLFDPISELLFLDHPGFYPAATPAHDRVTANAEIFRISSNVWFATPLHQIHR